jgi:exodeoxyribonuclease V gamma subunit
MMEVFLSNDLNVLFDKLLTNIENNQPDIFEPEFVVVQTDGIKKWLSLKIASKLGISCNISYVPPRQLIYTLLKSTGFNVESMHSFESNNLFWLILDIISSNPHKYGRLSDYIKDKNELKLAQVSDIIADLFDQYSIYRPEMINKWEKGKKIFSTIEGETNLDEAWQYELYRDITGKVKETTFPAYVLDMLPKKNVEGKNLCKRVSFFGISVLPPIYIDILNLFSYHLSIYMYLLNPSSDYWYEDISEKVFNKIMKNKKNYAEEKHYFSVKKNFLIDFGTLGKEFFTNLFSKTEDNINIVDAFVNEEENEIISPTMLSVIQRNILLNDDLNKIPQNKKYKIIKNDESIEIHSCHSPMREVEVLYNRLLNILEKNPDIALSDICIMTPNISEYKPYIEAIFNEKIKDKKIDYTISDVNFIDQSSLIKVFVDILNLVHSRFNAGEIFNIMEYKAVREKFKLNEADINILRICVNESKVKWGLNEETRKDIGIIPYKEFSWEYGIEKLLLSIIYENDETFSDILVIKGIETPADEAISALTDFVHILHDFYEFSKDKHEVTLWYDKLNELVGNVFQRDEENIDDFYALLDTLADLNAGYYFYKEKFSDKIEVGIDFINEYLKNNFQKKTAKHNFLDGRLNFCEMIPLRSIPFKIICIIGLNDDTFPRKRKPLSFDLMAQNPMRGDRNLRDNDKYLFLETIISAKEKFYLSYVGQDITTNDSMPPSVLITQFLYNMNDLFDFGEGKNAETFLINKHYLFSFNKNYFTQSKSDMYVNYWQSDYNAALLRLEGKFEVKNRFVDGEIDKQIEENIINIDDLIDFFRHPIKYYFKNTLSLILEDKDLIIDDEEPFKIDTLDRYNLKSSFIDKKMMRNIKKEQKKTSMSKFFKNAGILPRGGTGSLEIDKTKHYADRFIEELSSYFDLNDRRPFNVSLSFDKYRLEGVLRYFYEHKDKGFSDVVKTEINEIKGLNLLYYRPATVKAKDKVSCWIRHIILNYFEKFKGLIPSYTYYFGELKDYYFMLYEIKSDNCDIDRHLNFIIDTYKQGIKKPIHFFPDVSEEYFSNYKREQYSKEYHSNYKREQYKRILENHISGEYEEKDEYLSIYIKDLGSVDNFFNDEFKELSYKVFAMINELCNF